MTKNEHENGIIEAAWRTPLGTMTGRVSCCGVRKLHFPGPAGQTLAAPAAGVEIASLKNPGGGEVEPSHPAMAMVEAVTDFLKAFFAARPAGEGPKLDYNGVSEFDRAVWEAARRIPWGQTRTYGELAREIGRPGAARAVGGALGRNPLVLLVPCHRVISSAGGARALCGFTGGLELKKYLLALEGVAVQAF